MRRSAHGDWERPAGGPDPLAILREQELTRLPELLPLRHERMAASPFAFFRGAAAVMAADLAATPTSGERVQLCGDAHLANFGGFAAPDRELVFDLNDFDETLPGPWEWDVKRLAASVAIAGRDRGFGEGERDAAVRATVREYREALRGFAGRGHLDVWYARLDAHGILERWRGSVPARDRERFERNVEKSRGKTALKALEKLTARADGRLRIVADPPIVVPLEDLPGGAAPEVEQGVQGVLASYRASVTGATARLLERYRYVHAARKVVGVGSVGTRAWIVLLLGAGEHDPLFLQLKQAERSVLEDHLPSSAYRHHGRRVVEGQWLMQAASDICMGWVSVPGLDGRRRDFYVRQLWDRKRSADIDSFVPAGLAAYGQMCGWTLARAHARSGDAQAIGAYLGSGEAFDRALVRFAETYAEQNERDHAAFVASLAAEGAAASAVPAGAGAPSDGGPS